MAHQTGYPLHEVFKAPKRINYTALWIAVCVSCFLAGMLLCEAVHRLETSPVAPINNTK